MPAPFRFSLLMLCLAAGAGVVAQDSAKPVRLLSAFEAVGLLTPEDQAALARIAGRDGTPSPARWHLLIHDPAGEAGLREFTVADGKIAGAHPVSQFAPSLAPADVFAGNSLLFDSGNVARIAQEYCRTNGVTAAALHYDLRKGETDGAPLWTVICVNALGEELGRIVVHAGRGTVIYHPGFAAEPTPEQLLERARPAPLTTANTPAGAAADPSRSRPAPAPRHKNTPAEPTPKPNFFQRVFGGAGR